MVRKIVLIVMLAVPASVYGELTAHFPIEAVVRQAPYVVRGRVHDGLEVEIIENYRGNLSESPIAVGDLAQFNDAVQIQCREDSYERKRLEQSLSEKTFARVAQEGLVGSEVVLLLEKTGEEYRLKATPLRWPDSNYPRSALRVLLDGKVFAFSDWEGWNRYRLFEDPSAPDLEALKASIQYDEPLFVKFGYMAATGVGETHHYFYCGVSNLTGNEIRVDLEQNLAITLETERAKDVLPRECFGDDDLPAVLKAGQAAVGHCTLREEEMRRFGLEKGVEFTGTLSIAIGDFAYTQSVTRTWPW